MTTSGDYRTPGIVGDYGNPEQAFRLLAHIGGLTLAVISNMQRLGHRTLSGHAHYLSPSTGDKWGDEFINWLLQVTNHEPHDVTEWADLAQLAADFRVAARLDTLMDDTEQAAA